MNLRQWSIRKRISVMIALFFALFVMCAGGIFWSFITINNGIEKVTISNGKLTGEVAVLMTKDLDQIQNQLQTTMRVILISSLIMSVAVFGLGYILTNFLTRRLNKVSNKLTQGATDLELASKRISDTGTELATSTQEQAAALQETSAVLEQVSTMIYRNSESSEKSQAVATKSKQTAIRGKDSVDNMIHSIGELSSSQDEILHEVEDSNKRISEIVKLISEIETKTKVINEIVFQTKILSFNASVEAARAGENGKGFAVVAQEVGNLAQMSGRAAQEISVLLTDSIQKVESIISTTSTNVGNLISDGRKKVKHGEEVAQVCRDILSEVVHDVSNVSDLMTEITKASHEQTLGVAEINKAIQNLDKTTNGNSKAAEITSVDAESLHVQATELRLTIDDLRAFVSDKAIQKKINNMPVQSQKNKVPSVKVQNKTRQDVSPRNVIEMKSKQKTKTPLTQKVKIAPAPKIVAKENTKPNVTPKVIKGTDIPLESDPRFKDV